MRIKKTNHLSSVSPAGTQTGATLDVSSGANHPGAQVILAAGDTAATGTYGASNPWLRTGTATSSGGSVGLTASSGLSSNDVALLTDGGLIFASSQSSNAFVSIGAASSGHAIQLYAADMTATSTLFAPYISLVSAAASVGTPGTPIHLNSTVLQVISPNSVYLRNSAVNAFLLGSSAGTGQVFDYTNTSASATLTLLGSSTSDALAVPGGSVSLTTDSISILGGLDTGSTGSVLLKPLTNSQSIGIASATGLFNLTAAELGNITASQLTVGSNAITGAATAGTYAAPSSGAGAYNVIIDTQGGYQQLANTSITAPKLTLAIGSLTMLASSSLTAASDLEIDSLPSGALSVTLGSATSLRSTNGSISFNKVSAGAITMNSGTGDIAAATNGSILLNGGTGAVAVSVNSLGGKLTGSGSTFSASWITPSNNDNASVGSITATANITINAGSTTPASLTVTGPVSGADVSLTAGNIRVVQGGQLTATADLSVTSVGNDTMVILGGPASGANVTVTGGTVAVVAPVTIGAGGAGIFQTYAGSSGQVTFSADVTGGATTTTTGDSDVSQLRGTISGGTLTFTSRTGDVFAGNMIATGDITLQGANPSGNIKVLGKLSGANVNIQGADILILAPINVGAGNSAQITSYAGSGGGINVNSTISGGA